MTTRVTGIPDARSIAGLLLSLIASAIILTHFYDRFWYPPDEGIYAHVADRILAGEILNLDVQEIHFGHIAFINAFWLHLFGHNLISLRYPLLAISLLQAGLVYGLFSTRGVLVAATASISLTSLSFIQFLNPSAHWYCLFLAVLIIIVADRWPHGSRWRLETLGFLAVTLLFFRQLSGVFAGMGLVAYLLCETRENTRGNNRVLARLLILLMTGIVAWYLSRKTDPLTFLIFGLWPLGILAWAFFNTTVSNSSLLHMAGRLCIGGTFAAMPVLAYHLFHGSVTAWFNDTVLVALAISNMGVTHASHYASYLGYAILEVFQPSNLHAFVNGLFWIAMIFLTMANGLLLMKYLQNRKTQLFVIHPLPFFAVFYSLVSLYQQIPIYLFVTIGLTLISLLWLTCTLQGWHRLTPILLAASLSAAGLYYHAAQPLSRGAQGVLAGNRVAAATSRAPMLAASHLKIESSEAALYARLVDLIETETTASESILAIPSNPELYFLSCRRNPLRFSNAVLGMIDDSDLQSAREQLINERPVLVFYQPGDKYRTSYTDEIMDYIRHHYARIENIGSFEIYRYAGQQDD